MNFSSFKAGLIKRAPTIALGVGLSGTLAALVLAVKATPKALMLIDSAKTEKEAEELTALETVEAAWKAYIPTAITFIMSMACIIASHSIDARRNAALMAAYTLSDTALREYASKTVDIFGEKADRQIKDGIAKDKIENQTEHTVTKEILVATPAKCRCYEVRTGREWPCSMDILENAKYKINNRLLKDDSVSLNEFYYEVGLDPIRDGEIYGWNIKWGEFGLEYSSQIANDGIPTLVVSYSIEPRYGFDMNYIPCNL